MIPAWEEIQVYLMDPANLALFMTIGVVLVREVMFGFLRKQLGIKETQAEEIRARLDHIDQEEAEINQQQRNIAEAVLALGDMVNIAYQNSKLSPQTKAEIEKAWSPIVGTLGSLAIQASANIPNQIEEALNKILPDNEDQALLQSVRQIVSPLVQNAVNDQIEKLPEHIDNLSKILGSK
jgi:hypothetical protein